MIDEPAAASPFRTLWGAFLAQFFTDESATSDVKLRQTVIWIVAFLLVPGLFLLIQLFPELQAGAIRAKFHRGPASAVDDLLAWIVLLFMTYSMAATGFITVLAWDSLTFDRRDAMVLGTLPLHRSTILGAKLAALGSLLLVGSLPINGLNAALFAVETGDQAGLAVVSRHFVAFLLATTGASTMIFMAMVCIRGTVSLAGGSRLASACGPPLQFLCVVGLLCLAILCPFVLRISLTATAVINWMPPAWFLGVFEQLRGSTRAGDPRFPFAMLAHRALIVTPLLTLAAAVVSVVEFHRHWRQALAPPSVPGLLGRAHLTRLLARLMVPRDPVARAVSEFIVLTLARNRALQAPIAINAALGAALVIAGIAQNTRDLDSLLHPRTSLLWAPLVMGYWMTVGLRAAFFVPSELRASWSFASNGADAAFAYWSAVRASMVAFVLPRTVVLAAAVTPLLGWRIAAWHTLVVSTLIILLVEVVSLTIDFIPFTRPYPPGHAKLRTRWVIYVAGLWVFAYWPARLVLSMLEQPMQLIAMVSGLAAAIVAIEVRQRHRAIIWSWDQTEESADEMSATVLNLGGIVQSPTRPQSRMAARDRRDRHPGRGHSLSAMRR